MRLGEEIKSGKLKVLIASNNVQSRIQGLAKEITAYYEFCKEELIIVVLMDGSGMFACDLIRLLPFKLRSYFIQTKTYCGTEKVIGGGVDTGEFSDDFCNSILHNNVLVIDDVFDTGKSLESVYEAINIFSPKAIKTVVLISKNKCRECDIKPDFVGFNIEDKFIVGYGMDYKDYYRNLDMICVFNNGI